MKLKDFIEQLNHFDPDSDIIFSNKENRPYSLTRVDIGKLGIVNGRYVIDEMMFIGEDVEFDKNEPVEDVTIIKIDHGVFE